MAKILVIEDEDSILMPLEDNLRLEGYEVASAKDGRHGLSLAAEHPCDLIILDIMLPKMDGFEVCKRLRQDRVRTPILMLTAKSQEVDKVLGLELGADDYVTKPFSPRELLARVKAILRRASEPPREIDVFRFGDIELDFVGYEAKKSGRPVLLTALEFSLLQFFIQNRGRAIRRDEILDRVWGQDVFVDARTVDKHVSLLRKKFEDRPQEPRYFLGVRGIGYKFTG